MKVIVHGINTPYETITIPEQPHEKYIIEDHTTIEATVITDDVSFTGEFTFQNKLEPFERSYEHVEKKIRALFEKEEVER